MQKDSMSKSIVLGDGTILEDSFCYNSGAKGIWCFVNGKTILDCAKLFSDPYRTSSITSYHYATRHVYKGFTELLLIQKADDRGVDVRLTWSENKPHSVEEFDEDLTEL